MPTVSKRETFTPVLLSSRSLAVSLEQRDYLKEILAICCSDSRFAEKAYVAINLVLTKGSSVAPIIASLTPAQVEVGQPSFTLRVIGTGFKSDSIIMFNGGAEPTVYVSATELNTGVDMSTVLGPVAVPVAVQNSDGILSDPVTFSFIETAPLLATVGSAKTAFKEEKTTKEVMKEEKKEEKK